MGPLNRILILFAHPALEKSRLNSLFLKAVKDLSAVTLQDLYEQYPNFHINVAQEKALLMSHDIIVFQHPIYWYSCPSILKEWQDLVLEYGFAYGKGGTALQGKKFLSAVTTGGGSTAYSLDGLNRFTLRQFLLPFEQTAYLCGMDYLPPYVTFGTHQMLDSTLLQAQAQSYRQVITALRDNRVDWDNLRQRAYFNEDLTQVIYGEAVETNA
jgi:glutathione-regulated potassium-efflux system ancillary protein KefG